MQVHNLALRTAASAALLALAPALASATPACGGSSFSTCASVNITKTLLSNGNVRIRIEVLNQAGLGGTFDRVTITRLGLWGLDSARYVPGSLVVGGAAEESDWRLAALSAADDSVPKELRMRSDLRGVRLRPGVVLGLRQEQPASFEFDLAGVPIDSVNVNNWELHFEADGCSTDMVAQNGTLNEAKQDRALCEPVMTPEPGTLLFFTTGLAGLSSFQWLRRRRRK